MHLTCLGINFRTFEVHFSLFLSPCSEPYSTAFDLTFQVQATEQSFVDYLEACYSQGKLGEEASSNPGEEQVHKTIMAEFAGVMTLDGEPPNGAVPPGTLLQSSQEAEDLPPHGGMPLEAPASNQTQSHVL